MEESARKEGRSALVTLYTLLEALSVTLAPIWEQPCECERNVHEFSMGAFHGLLLHQFSAIILVCGSHNLQNLFAYHHTIITLLHILFAVVSIRSVTPVLILFGVL